MLLLYVLFWASWALIFYTYLVFPILIAIVARLFARYPATPDVPYTAEDDLPRIAMIVAAYNEAEVIDAKVQNALRLDYPADRFAVYVGSDGSSDETPCRLLRHSDKRLYKYIFAERRGKISVVNDLVDRADAEIIVLSDASTIYRPDTLRKLVRHFRDPRVGCVEARLLLTDGGGNAGEGVYIRYNGWIKQCESRLGCVTGCSGAALAMRRSLFRKLPATTINDDHELTVSVIRNGFFAISDREALVYDAPTVGVRGEMTRKARIGAGALQTLWHTRGLVHPRYGLGAFAYVGHKVLRWLVPFLMVAAGGANVALAAHPFFTVTLAAQVCCVGIALYGAHLPSGRSLPRLLRPVSYFYLMNYSLLRGYMRYWANRQSVRWERPQCSNGALVDMSIAVVGHSGGPRRARVRAQRESKVAREGADRGSTPTLRRL